MSNTKAPNAIVIDAWPNRTYPGCFIVKVSCPHCPKTHTHGVQSLTEPAGHRVSHCGSEAGNSGYNIVIPDGFKAASK